MIEQLISVAFFVVVIGWTLKRFVKEFNETRNNRRPNQDIQPLLGVVLPEDSKNKKDKLK